MHGRAGSGRLGHPAGVAAGIVRRRLDGRGGKRFRRVWKQFARIVRNGCIRVDVRARLG